MYPFLTFNSSLLLSTYVFMMSVIYCISLLWAIKRADQKGLSRHKTLDYSLVIMISGVLGARLVHVIFEYPDYYLKYPFDIFLLYQGGFVFYGGFLFAFLGCFIIIKYRKDSLTLWMDFFTPIISFGYALGRIGCFLGGCCYGKPSSISWAITFSPDALAPANIPLHPTQLYLSGSEFIIFALILFAEKKKLFPKGCLFYFWLLLHSISRLIVEPFRGDFRGEVFLSLSLSSWISVFFIVTCLFYFGRFIKSSLLLK